MLVDTHIKNISVQSTSKLVHDDSLNMGLNSKSEPAPDLAQVELQQVLKEAGQAIRIVNKDSTIRYINSTFAEMVGLKAVDVIGRKCWEVFHSSECNTPKCRLNRILLGEMMVQDETNRTKADGTTITCIVTAVHLYGTNGKIIGSTEIFSDVGELKKAIARLRDSEVYYKALVDLGTTVGEAIIVLQDIKEREGVHIFVSQEWSRITGYSQDELLKMSFFDLVSPMYRPASLARHRRKMAGESIPGLFQFSVIRKNGTEIPVELTSASTDFRGSRVDVAYIRDISERIAMGNALNESESLYRTIFEAAGTAVTIVDKKGFMTLINKEWERLFGYSKQESEGCKTFAELIHPDDVERMQSYFYLRPINPDAVPETYEARLIAKTGNVISALCTAQMIPGSSNRVISALNITTRKQSEDELRAYKEVLERTVNTRALQLEQANHKLQDLNLSLKSLYESEQNTRKALEEQARQRTEFTRALVHEIKTPLTALMAASELLNAGCSQEQANSLAKHIFEGSLELNARTDELFDLARGEMGILKIKPTRVDMVSLFNEVAETVAPEARLKGQRFMLDIEPSLPVAMVDETRIKQVTLNILNNAVKFTQEGGTIIFSAKMDKSELLVEIKDTGPGITEEEKQWIFEPYHRSSRDADRVSGLGLGLSIAKTLITLHNGCIWVESQPGNGSSFYFSLPIAN